MLFNEKWAESKIAGPSLVYPSMAGLVHILRNKELWPKGFQWRTPWHASSATKLAKEMWPDSVGPRERDNDDLTQMLAMGLSSPSDQQYVYWQIFYSRMPNGRSPGAKEVADRLETFMQRDTNKEAFQKLQALRLGC